MGYDYTVRVMRNDGKRKQYGPAATPGVVRAQAKRFLAGHGGRWDMSYRISEGWNRGMVTGGESARMTADGRVRY